jgi:two-component system, OmpR family, phosphate regulon sensor histidine kinase PhoR
VLAFSRSERRSGSVNPVELELEREVRDAVESFTPLAKARRATLRLALEPGLGVRADRNALRQILLNLLDNAVKYTLPKGQVRLTGAREGDRARVEVIDTGVGLEPRHLPRIFERFYRVDKGRSRDMGGTGLGLSIVKHLLTAMGGDVQVTSRPGAGSTFTVLFRTPAPAPRTDGVG